MIETEEFMMTENKEETIWFKQKEFWEKSLENAQNDAIVYKELVELAEKKLENLETANKD